MSGAKIGINRQTFSISLYQFKLRLRFPAAVREDSSPEQTGFRTVLHIFSIEAEHFLRDDKADPFRFPGLQENLFTAFSSFTGRTTLPVTSCR